jgi:hypothetical protein
VKSEREVKNRFFFIRASEASGIRKGRDRVSRVYKVKKKSKIPVVGFDPTTSGL